MVGSFCIAQECVAADTGEVMVYDFAGAEPTRRGGAMGSWACRLGLACTILFFAMAPAAQASDDKDAPRYVNDPSWPKPFAHHWVMGQIGGLTVDDHDRIWVLQRALP